MHAVTFYAVVADGKVVDGPLREAPGKLEVKKVKMTHTYEPFTYEDGPNEYGHVVIREARRMKSHFEIIE